MAWEGRETIILLLALGRDHGNTNPCIFAYSLLTARKLFGRVNVQICQVVKPLAIHRAKAR